MKAASKPTVLEIPTEVWESADTKEEMEDWLLAHNPKLVRQLRHIRRKEDLSGAGKSLSELARNLRSQGETFVSPAVTSQMQDRRFVLANELIQGKERR